MSRLRGLVVEQPVPPVAGDVLGQDDDRDRRLLVRRPGLVEDVEVGDDRRDDRPVRRLDDDQRHVRELALPARAERVGRLEVVGDVDGPDVGASASPEVDRLDDRAVDAVDRDDRPAARGAARAGRRRRGPGAPPPGRRTGGG